MAVTFVAVKATDESYAARPLEAIAWFRAQFGENTSFLVAAVDALGALIKGAEDGGGANSDADDDVAERGGDDDCAAGGRRRARQSSSRRGLRIEVGSRNDVSRKVRVS